MSMLKYALRRLIVALPVLFGVLTMSFILSRMMPGDPIRASLELQGIARPNEVQYAQMAHQLGLDLPIILQYFRYLGDLFTGNWGVSISIARHTPVWDLITERLPRTIDLTIFSMIIAAYVGTKIGVISATHRNKARDTIFRGVALIGVAVPIFFLGMILQYTLGYLNPIFPATQYKNMDYADPATVTGFYMIDAIIAGELYKIPDYLYHLILPVFCLSFVTIASIVRQTRSSMLEVLQQDYVRTARAKGCKERTVIHSHALKNALIPTVTIIGLNVAGLLSGAVLTETTFGLNGIGMLLIDSIVLTDYWVIDALVFVVTIIFISSTLITDLLYGMLDPRIRF
ncbi:MAG: ABC transporter permease [Promethearchaeota archaeon]|jgi:peptide/nickel transport system permease protein